MDLDRSPLAVMSADCEQQQPTLCPVPPRTVADMAGIDTSGCTDLIVLVSSVSPGRTTPGGYQIADVQLVDDSKIDEELASVAVGVSARTSSTV